MAHSRNHSRLFTHPVVENFEILKGLDRPLEDDHIQDLCKQAQEYTNVAGADVSGRMIYHVLEHSFDPRFEALAKALIESKANVQVSHPNFSTNLIGFATKNGFLNTAKLIQQRLDELSKTAKNDDTKSESLSPAV